MRIAFIIFTGCLLIFNSCNRSSRSDSSLRLEGYRKLNIPDPNRIWTFKDIATTYSVLISLKFEHPFELPVKESKKSGMLFNRMISLENLDFLNNDSIPLYEKAHRIKGYLKVIDDWIDLYTNIRMRNQYYHRELIAIHIFGLNVTQKMLDLANKIKASDDPGDIAMKSGDQSIRKMYIDYLLVTLEIQKDMSPYMKEDMERMGDLVSASVIKNKDWMDSANKSKIIEELQLVIDRTSIGYIRDKYESLSEILSN